MRNLYVYIRRVFQVTAKTVAPTLKRKKKEGVLGTSFTKVHSSILAKYFLSVNQVNIRLVNRRTFLRLSQPSLRKLWIPLGILFSTQVSETALLPRTLLARAS